jgi:hypothetical protein
MNEKNRHRMDSLGDDVHEAVSLEQLLAIVSDDVVLVVAAMIVVSPGRRFPHSGPPVPLSASKGLVATVGAHVGHHGKDSFAHLPQVVIAPSLLPKLYTLNVQLA